MRKNLLAVILAVIVAGAVPVAAQQPRALTAADYARAVFIRDWNLWVRDLATDQEKPLTTDGVKDFDLLLLPNQGHGYGTLAPYMMRRRWDYFVKWLLGAEPPKEYQMQQPAGGRGGTPQEHRP